MKHTKQCVNRRNTQGQAVLKQATPSSEEIQDNELTSMKLFLLPFGCSLESFEIIVSRFCLGNKAKSF